MSKNRLQLGSLRCSSNRHLTSRMSPPDSREIAGFTIVSGMTRQAVAWQGSEGPVDLHPYADQECAQGTCPQPLHVHRKWSRSLYFSWVRTWNMGCQPTLQNLSTLLPLSPHPSFLEIGPPPPFPSSSLPSFRIGPLKSSQGVWDAVPKSNLMHLALKYGSWWQHVNIFVIINWPKLVQFKQWRQIGTKMVPKWTIYSAIWQQIDVKHRRTYCVGDE